MRRRARRWRGRAPDGGHRVCVGAPRGAWAPSAEQARELLRPLLCRGAGERVTRHRQGLGPVVRRGVGHGAAVNALSAEEAVEAVAGQMAQDSGCTAYATRSACRATGSCSPGGSGDKQASAVPNGTPRAFRVPRVAGCSLRWRLCCLAERIGGGAVHVPIGVKHASHHSAFESTRHAFLCSDERHLVCF